MPGVTICIYAYNYVSVHLWYGRTRTIGAPQHDTKHTMDTSCGTPWNTSTMDVPRERSIHISRVVPLAFTGTRSCFFSPAATFFFSFLSYVLSFLTMLLFPHPPCYQVQGQPIEGNFLVPIASACPPRTIRFVLLFFILAGCSLFFILYLLFFLPISLLFHAVVLQIRG